MAKFGVRGGQLFEKRCIQWFGPPQTFFGGGGNPKRPLLERVVIRSETATSRAMAVSWLLAAGERHSSARRSIRTARPGPIEPPRRAGHADMRTTHIGVKATELQHQQTSLTLNQKHNVEPWGALRTPGPLYWLMPPTNASPPPIQFPSYPSLSFPTLQPDHKLQITPDAAMCPFSSAEPWRATSTGPCSGGMLWGRQT